MREFENPSLKSNLEQAEELSVDSTNLRDEAWASFSNAEKFYFAKLYFELLDVPKRDEVWNFCSPEDRFTILSQQHYYSAVEDQLRDESLGFIKGRDSQQPSKYFNLLTNDSQKNEAWALLPEFTANDWHHPWASETPDDVMSLNDERQSYFHSIVLVDWRMRIGCHDTDEGELWKTLNVENKCKYFNFFPSLCSANQKTEVWQYLNEDERALLVTRTPFYWTMFMLFDKETLHDKEKDEAWKLLDNEAKVIVMIDCTSSISDAHRDEAWALAGRNAKISALNYSPWSLSEIQREETWALMTQKERDHTNALNGFR